MRAHRIIWSAATGVTALLALAGTRAWMPIDLAVAMIVLTAGLGALVGLVFKDDLPRIGHPVRRGAVLFAAPTLYPGLAEILGEASAVVVGALLVAGSPGALNLVRRWLRGRLLPSETEQAVMAGPDEALRRQWEESTRLLHLASTPAEQLRVLRLRGQILDDVVRQSGGAVPDYVWTPPDRGEHGWFARGS